jgi:hypothetical protein
MNQRDVELLSSYLDGQLSPSDSARLESRLKTDRELVSVLDDLRAARNLLRSLPQRRAPRNFTLTHKMVGQNPPLPRAYPVFRFATALATLLFFFTFGVNTLAPQFASQPSAFGVGGGAEQPESFSAQAPAATEAAAAELAPPETSMESTLAPMPTQPPPAEDAARVQETPAAKYGDTGNVEGQSQPQVTKAASLVPSNWQVVLAVIAIAGAFFMLVMRRSAAKRWHSKE